MKTMSGIVPLAALSIAFSPAAAMAAAVPINGGGAASQDFDYAAPDVNGAPVSEQFLFDTLDHKVEFGTYWSTISKAAQTGLLQNDLTCISNAATGANGGLCSNAPGGANTVHYAVSETVFSPTSIAQWSTSSWGQSVAGNLIQLPAMGTGLAIVVNDTNITKNGAAVFSDSDLCEIFSGGYTDFSQITDSATAPAAGLFSLVYRADAAGTTYSLTNHLAAVCNSTNTAPGVTFTPTSSFSTLFTAVPITTQIPGGYPVTGLSKVANLLAGLVSGPIPQAIGYISPDWTSVDSATSSAKLSNGLPSPLIVAALTNNGKAYLPVATNIALGLNHILIGSPRNPPSTAAQGADPSAWVPVIQTVSRGYPIVTYSTIDVPQCYANTTIQAAMIAFLHHHYVDTNFRTIQANNGLVSVANTTVAKFLTPILADILANKHGWNTNIGNATACAGKAGR